MATPSTLVLYSPPSPHSEEKAAAETKRAGPETSAVETKRVGPETSNDTDSTISAIARILTHLKNSTRNQKIEAVVAYGVGLSFLYLVVRDFFSGHDWEI